MSPLCAESRAILKSLRLAKRIEFEEITLISDSLSLIVMLRGETGRVTKAYSLLWDIEIIKKSFRSVRFIHTNRDYNHIAHKLAQVGLSNPPRLWVGEFPYWLLSMNHCDKSLFIPVKET